jgi:hypothetical protein
MSIQSRHRLAFTLAQVYCRRSQLQACAQRQPTSRWPRLADASAVAFGAPMPWSDQLAMSFQKRVQHADRYGGMDRTKDSVLCSRGCSPSVRSDTTCVYGKDQLRVRNDPPYLRMASAARDTDTSTYLDYASNHGYFHCSSVQGVSACRRLLEVRADKWLQAAACPTKVQYDQKEHSELDRM